MESNPKVKVFISFNLYRSSVTSLTKELHVLAIDDNKKVTILTFISIHILIIISQVINGNGIVQKRYDDNGCINCFFSLLRALYSRRNSLHYLIPPFLGTVTKMFCLLIWNRLFFNECQDWIICRMQKNCSLLTNATEMGDKVMKVCPSIEHSLPSFGCNNWHI